MIDGEVALDEGGRPSFQILQNYGNSPGPVVFFIFDLLILSGRDLKKEPLSARRELEKKVLPMLKEPIRYSAELDASLPDLIAAVRLKGSRGWPQSAVTASSSRAFAQAPGRSSVSTPDRNS